jgi:hypothetical protein
MSFGAYVLIAATLPLGGAFLAEDADLRFGNLLGFVFFLGLGLGSLA